MKTPNLFVVPKDHPSRKERIEAFKNEHSIQTFHSQGMAREDSPWTAAWMTPIWKMGYGVTEGMALPECFAHVCRLIEEYGYCSYGKSEADAIRKVCVRNGMNCSL